MIVLLCGSSQTRLGTTMPSGSGRLRQRVGGSTYAETASVTKARDTGAYLSGMLRNAGPEPERATANTWIAVPDVITTSKTQRNPEMRQASARHIDRAIPARQPRLSQQGSYGLNQRVLAQRLGQCDFGHVIQGFEIYWPLVCFGGKSDNRCHRVS